MEKVEIKVNPTRLKPLTVGNKVFRSAIDYEISPEDAEQARTELNETEDVRNTCLRNLKEMLSKDDLRFRTDDAYLLRFLRSKKFKCKEAYKMMRLFYSIRKDHSDVLGKLPSNLEEMLNINMFAYLPYRDADGSIIFLDKIGKWNAETQSVQDLLQIVQPMIDIITMNPSCQINKIITIMDCGGLGTKHLSAAIYPSSLRLWANVTQNAYPQRIKYVILFNCNKLIRTSLNAARYILTKKVAERLVVLGSDVSKLHEYINPAILPKEYGGSLEESECCITQHIMDNLPYLQYELSFSNV